MRRLHVFLVIAALCLGLWPLAGVAAQSAEETREIAAIEQQVLAGQRSDPVAVVNGQAIPHWMFDNALRDRLASLPAAERDNPETLVRERQAILDNLLKMELLSQEAARHGVEADVAAGLLRAGIMARAHGNDLLFAKALAKAGMTRQQYVDIWKQQVSVNRLVSEVLQPTIVIEEDAMRARYAQDLPQLTIPRRVKAVELFAPWTGAPDDLATLTPLLVNAARSLSKVDSAEDFQAGAKTLSQGPLQSVRGLALRARDWMPTADNATLEQAGAAGWKAGETVGPFPSSEGLHLWRVTAVEAPRQATFEDVRDSLQVQMLDEATHQTIDARVADLRRTATLQILLQ